MITENGTVRRIVGRVFDVLLFSSPSSLDTMGIRGLLHFNISSLA